MSESNPEVNLVKFNIVKQFLIHQLPSYEMSAKVIMQNIMIGSKSTNAGTL